MQTRLDASKIDEGHVAPITQELLDKGSELSKSIGGVYSLFLEDLANNHAGFDDDQA